MARALPFLAATTASALACGGGGAQNTGTAAAGLAPSGAPQGGTVFLPNEIAAYEIRDPNGAAIGRAHSRFLRSEEGDLQVVTRVASGPGHAVEHATTFRRDLSPIGYKRLSSLNGRYELDFGSDVIRVLTDTRGRDVKSKRILTVIVPPDDLMMLAVALSAERLPAGDSAVMDVFSPDALASSPWTLRAFADAEGRRVIETPTGRATLDPRGRVSKYEADDGRTFVEEVPPRDPPKVEYSPPLVYELPAAARWDDRPADVPVNGGVFRGVISMPRDRGRWPNKLAPAVVFASDDGPQDRHGFQGAVDFGTWAVLDHLVDQGIAVLRIDDRETGASTSTVANVDHAIAVADVRALARFVERQEGVDPERIFLVGHGKGAVFAADAAPRVRPRGLVLISMPFAAGKKIDTKGILSALDLPVAVFQGLKDFQVSWKTDAKQIVEALEKSVGKKRVKYFAYDRVDHLMKNEPRDSSFERYADRSRAVDQRFLDDLAAWILAQ